MGARIAPPLMEATDARRLVCVVVVSYQEYSLTRQGDGRLQYLCTKKMFNRIPRYAEVSQAPRNTLIIHAKEVCLVNLNGSSWRLSDRLNVHDAIGLHL